MKRRQKGLTVQRWRCDRCNATCEGPGHLVVGEYRPGQMYYARVCELCWLELEPDAGDQLAEVFGQLAR